MYSDSDFENRVLFSIDFENFIAQNLDIREMLISYLMFTGYNIVEIAKHEECSRRTITTVVKNIRTKFRRFLKIRGYRVK